MILNIVLIISIIASFKGYYDMALGVIIGCNLFNLLVTVGLSSIIKPIKFRKDTKLEAIMSLIFSVIFVAICNINLKISRLDGLLLIALYILFIFFQFRKSDKNRKNIDIKNLKKYIIRAVILIVIGIFAVYVISKIVQVFNISQKIISIIVLSIVLSLPELYNVIHISKNSIDVGKILNQNISNTLFASGISALINPITYSVSYNLEMIILLWGTLILLFFPIIPPKNEMNKTNGLVYLLLYILYICLTIFVF